MSGHGGDLFHPDPDQSDSEKRRRELHFHTVTVPRLRLIGFGMVIALAAVRQALVHAPDGWALTFRLAIFLLAYGVASWAALRAWYERINTINLGDFFLALDVLPFLVAIYVTGANESWLFFLLFIRVADQASTNFRRALAFGHLSVAGYAALILLPRLHRTSSDLLAHRGVQTGAALRRERVRRDDGADRRAAARASGRDHPPGQGVRHAAARAVGGAR